jgi:outer membrane autotransporter protein
MASGSFNNNRQVNVFGASTSLGSDSSIFLAGSRLRAGYEFDRGDWYIKPYGDMDVVYTHAPGFKEGGSSPYALNVRTADQTNVSFSPMVEFGRRGNLDPKTTIRAYAAFGMSWRPDNTRTVRSSFVNSDSADGTFTDYVKSPEVLAKVDLGVQVFRAGGYEVRAGYTADIGNHFTSQSATARFAYHF